MEPKGAVFNDESGLKGKSIEKFVLCKHQRFQNQLS